MENFNEIKEMSKIENKILDKELLKKLIEAQKITISNDKENNSEITIEIKSKYKITNDEKEEIYEINKLGDKLFYDNQEIKNIIKNKNLYISIEEGIEEIGKETFKDCKNLKSIILPKSLKKIEKQAFQGCNLLQEITIPKNVKIIGEHSFNDCTSLTTVIIEEGIEIIEEWAFASCPSLKAITIPKSVKEIKDWAFALFGDLQITINNKKDNIKISEFAFYHPTIKIYFI